MSTSIRLPSPLAIGALGSAGLASAMGIGRFAFTPLLPLMQESFGMSLSQGAWLASANYLGYLVGATLNFFFNPSSGSSARWGLVVVAVTTLAMALPAGYSMWFVFRFASGCASAFVLVGAGAWALAHLASHGRGQWSGWVFAGVGAGIIAAGLVSLAAATSRLGPQAAWLGLGLIASAVATLAWRYLGVSADVTDPAAAPAQPQRGGSRWLLVASYGALGFGYIIPATFIPAAARMLVNDPEVFGWAWPIFGLAAGASTVIASRFFHETPPRKMAACSLLIMAIGVLAPAVFMSLATLVASAVCVGGTFMVMTMAGVQEARRISPGSPTKLMAALTAAFALGQLAGPIAVSRHAGSLEAFIGPSVLATALLICAGVALLTSERNVRSA